MRRAQARSCTRPQEKAVALSQGESSTWNALGNDDYDNNDAGYRACAICNSPGMTGLLESLVEKVGDLTVFRLGHGLLDARDSDPHACLGSVPPAP